MKNDTTPRKRLALTFDDGPDTAITAQMLDILERYSVTASFFLLGRNITAETVPVICRAAAMGCELANHSFSHCDMTALTAEAVRREYDETSRLISGACGQQPRFFRPPYIAVNDTMFAEIGVPFIAGFGAEDFRDEVTADERFTRVMQQVRDGAIILLHDAAGNTQTVDAVARLIPALLEQGYAFMTVSQLFTSYQITPDPAAKILYSHPEQTTMYYFAEC